MPVFWFCFQDGSKYKNVARLCNFFWHPLRATPSAASPRPQPGVATPRIWAPVGRPPASATPAAAVLRAIRCSRWCAPVVIANLAFLSIDFVVW